MICEYLAYRTYTDRQRVYLWHERRQFGRNGAVQLPQTRDVKRFEVGHRPQERAQDIVVHVCAPRQRQRGQLRTSHLRNSQKQTECML